MTTATEAKQQKSALESSVCLVLQFSSLWTKRAVSTEHLDVEADKSMFHISKDLFEAPELKAIQKIDREIRGWLGDRSLPSPLFKRAAMLFSVDMIEDVYEFLESKAKERTALIEKLVEASPRIIREAKERLKDQWKKSEYPSKEALEQAFDLRWQVIEWGPDKKLKTISKAIYDKERKKAEAEWADATSQIRDALRGGMQELITHMVDRLAGEGGEAKRFKQASIDKIELFLETFNKRNILGDDDLKALVDKARKAMSGVDAKMLRDDDKARTSVTKSFGEIKTVLDTMMENAPKRRMTLDDEGAV